MTDLVNTVEQALMKRKANLKRQARIDSGQANNPRIHRKLELWAQWLLGQHAEYGGCGSMLAAVMDSGGVFVRSTAEGTSMPDDIYDTERAVMLIDEKYRQAVFQKYLELDKNDEQRGKALGVSGRTFRRYVATAQQQIQFCLKAPVRKTSVRDSMLKNRQR